MNKEGQKKTIHGEVLDKIKSGRVSMRPRWYFLLQALLVVLGILILALTLLFMASFVIFVLSQSEAWLLPSFGFLGIVLFLQSLPKLLIIAGIVFVILLEVLVRRYSFAYRKPLLVTLAGIIGFTSIAGAAFARFQVHEQFLIQAREGKLPIAGPLYRSYGGNPSHHLHPGVVKEITEEGLKIERKTGETVSIVVDPETSFPLGVDFEEGDKILVIGEKDNGDIKASGIRKIENKTKHKMRHKGWFKPSKDAR